MTFVFIRAFAHTLIILFYYDGFFPPTQHTHTHRGPWTNAENTFSNEYFRLLLEERWSPKMTHNGKPWDGPDQYEDSTGQLMMLPSDLFLLADPEFKKWVEVYAKDENKFFKDFGEYNDHFIDIAVKTICLTIDLLWHAASAFGKLLSLGVPSATVVKPWYQFW